nr:unnamed protein product [Callosobruchus analis]
MKFPSSQGEWLEIIDGFKNMWGFEHCLGAMDRKHIAIKKPINSGSFHYNYKGFHSMVLFAIEFIYVHTGINGRIWDGGVMRETVFFQKFESDTLNLPPSNTLERARRVVENVFYILASRFRILLTTIIFTNLKNVDAVILACCTLHNF